MISNQEYINLFFSRSHEKEIEKLMLNDKNYILPKDKIMEYVETIISIPYSEFLDYLKLHQKRDKIKSTDITQTSSFSNSEANICYKMLFANNTGMKAAEIGRLFPDYVSSCNNVSFTKYGENQIKTAEHLGLAFNYYDYWYLGCFAYIYQELYPRQRLSLLARTLLRNNLYSQIIVDSTNEDLLIEKYMYCLQISTIERRMPSVSRLLSICINECYHENIKLHKVLEYRKKKYKKDTTIYYVNLNSEPYDSYEGLYNILHSSNEQIVLPNRNNCYDNNFKPLDAKYLMDRGIFSKNEDFSYGLWKIVNSYVKECPNDSKLNVLDIINTFDFLKRTEREKIADYIKKSIFSHLSYEDYGNKICVTNIKGNVANLIFVNYLESTNRIDDNIIFEQNLVENEHEIEELVAAENIDTNPYSNFVLIKKKKLDWCIFNDGVRLHEKQLGIIEDVLNEKIEKGSNIPVKIRFNSTNYDCSIVCPQTRIGSKTIMFQWNEKGNSKIAKALQRQFHDTYSFLKHQAYSGQNLKLSPVPSNLERNIYLTYIPGTKTFAIETQWKNDDIDSNEEDNNAIEQTTIPEELRSRLNIQLEVFSKMKRSSRNGIKAPHKPVLLIASIMLYEKGMVRNGILEFTKYLKSAFEDVWSAYVTDKDIFSCNPYMPFTHIDESIGEYMPYFSPPHISLSKNLLTLLQNNETREIMKRHLISMIN